MSFGLESFRVEWLLVVGWIAGCVAPEPGRDTDTGAAALPDAELREPVRAGTRPFDLLHAPEGCTPVSGWRDADGDGFGAGPVVSGCAGIADDDRDCDDTRSAVHPDAFEACNGIDDDCDPLTVEFGLTRDGVRYATLRDALDERPTGDIGLCAGDFEGPVYVRGRLALRGAGAGLTRIDALGRGPGIEVQGGGTLILTGVTVTGGQSIELGGGVAVNANAVARLEDVMIVGNTAATGAGLFVGGTAQVFRTVVTDNRITDSSFAPAAVFAGQDATLLLEDVEITGNTTSGLWSDGAFVDVVRGRFADHHDAGIRVAGSGEVVVQSTVFEDTGAFGIDLRGAQGEIDVSDAAFAGHSHDVRLPDGRTLDAVGLLFAVRCTEGVCDL